MIADLATASDIERVLARQDAIEAKLDRVLAALPSQWLSLKKAAGLMGCDPRTVVAMGERGDIVTRKAGRRVLIDAASLRPTNPADVAAAAREARR
jgi:hypothetical protein